jgi:O-antigen/teichoic acid export membrane protein
MNDKKNSSWLAFQYIITVVFSFISIKINLSNFGEELFGIWILFISIWTIGNALDIGFGTAIVKFVAESIGGGKSKEISKIASTTLLILALNGIIIFVLVNLASDRFLLNNERIVPLKIFSMAQNVFFILGINFYFQYVTIVFKAILEGMNNFVYTSKVNMLSSFLNLLVVLVVSIFNQSMVVMSMFLALISLSIAILLFIYIFSRYRQIQFGIKYINVKDLSKLLKFSFYIQGSAIFSSLIDPTIKYIIGYYSGLNFVSFYEVGRRFATAVSGLFFNTFKTILPKASILKGSNQYNIFLSSVGSNLSYYGVIYSVTIFGVGSIVFSMIIKTLFGHDEILIVFFLLCLPESINNFGYSLYLFLIGIGKSNVILLIQAVNLIVITLLLLACFEFLNSILGLLGYYITVVFVNILMIFLIKKVSGFSIKSFLQRVQINKLINLNIFIVCALLLLYLTKIHYLIITGVISILSIFLIKNDLIANSKLILSSFVNDYVKRNNK